MSGITASGFVRKTRDEIKSDLIAYARTQFGNDVDFSPYSYEGQLLEIATENANQIWEELEKQYYAVYPQSATGAQLDRIGAFSGVSRRPAVSASVSLTFTGTNTTVIPSGFSVQTANGVQFNTTEDVTITGGEAIVDALADVAGVSGIVSENSIVEIVNPLAGVSTVNNPLPSYGGLDIESDLDYRTRILSLGISGKSSIGDLKRQIDLLQGVSSSRVFENNNDFVYNDLPGHSIEVIVSGGNKNEIGKAIYENKPAGIQSVSNYAVIVGQIKIKAKLKGKCFYQLTLIEYSSNTKHDIVGNNIYGDYRNFIIYYQTGSDYNDLKSYIDTNLSEWLTSEISGAGTDSVIDTNQLFSGDADNRYTFTDDFGTVQSLEFSRPVLAYIKVKINVKINDNWIESNEGLLKENVVRTIGGLYNGIQYAGLGIGQSVKEWILISANSGVTGIDDIDYLFALSPSNPVSNALIQIQNNEQAQVLESDIEVVYV